MNILNAVLVVEIKESIYKSVLLNLIIFVYLNFKLKAKWNKRFKRISKRFN